ncbi:hypothetical protein FB567DRAFT_546036 [Paraphoma chrysanthemicola]|uniref:Uncharacterized protein n=1 Tax=Paraphoma chrysanthemicola TaxID=798071 RepID=A0A8K0W1T7_9PLEO|nr:hypothetical protein FB567DRAFT_546036 [Paraphoma chrysanthemicola]
MALSKGAIAGIAVGSFFSFVIIIGICVFCVLKRKKRTAYELSQPSHFIARPPPNALPPPIARPQPIQYQPGSFQLSEQSYFGPGLPPIVSPAAAAPRPIEPVNQGSMQVMGIWNAEPLEPISPHPRSGTVKTVHEGREP